MCYMCLCVGLLGLFRTYSERFMVKIIWIWIWISVANNPGDNGRPPLHTMIIMIQPIQDDGNFTYISDSKLTEGAVQPPPMGSWQVIDWQKSVWKKKVYPKVASHSAPVAKYILSKQKKVNLPIQFWTVTEPVWLMFWWTLKQHHMRNAREREVITLHV